MTKRILLIIACAVVAASAAAAADGRTQRSQRAQRNNGFAVFAAFAVNASGDPAAGGALFRGSGACLTCHSLDLRGGGSASDLSWIGMLRSADALRRVLTDASVHPATFSPADIEHLVAYLRTLRSLPPSEPRERTREISTVSENVEFFVSPSRATI